MSAKRVLFLVLVASAVVLAVGAGPRTAGTVRALPPAQKPGPAGGTIPYSGRLDNQAGQPAVDGTYAFTFALYSAETGGQPLWSEVQEGVAVKEGAFAVSLGSATSLPTDRLVGREALWLAVGVRGPGETEFTALAPRQRLSAASPSSPASPSAGAACPHDHVGEWWTAAISWGNGAFKVSNSLNGPSVWGVNNGGGNAVRGEAWGGGLGVYGFSDSKAGVVGRSDTWNGVEGYSSAPDVWAGVYGEALRYGVFGRATMAGWYGVFSDGAMGTTGDLWVGGNLTVQGLATFNGGKNGYVVDVAQNDDTLPLEAGEVVVISGAGPAVVGDIPVIKVRRATSSGTSAVVGVVDRHYIPAPKTAAPNVKAQSAVDDAAIAPGEYLTVVTLGAYKAIKVDASFGAIAPGDLLVASPHAGYAMRIASPAPGMVIGKALGVLESGTGVIPVIITLQ